MSCVYCYVILLLYCYVILLCYIVMLYCYVILCYIVMLYCYVILLCYIIMLYCYVILCYIAMLYCYVILLCYIAMLYCYVILLCYIMLYCYVILLCYIIMLYCYVILLCYIAMLYCYVCNPRSFLVINVYNQGKTLCSPCIVLFKIFQVITIISKVLATWIKTTVLRVAEQGYLSFVIKQFASCYFKKNSGLPLCKHFCTILRTYIFLLFQL